MKYFLTRFEYIACLGNPPKYLFKIPKNLASMSSSGDLDALIKQGYDFYQHGENGRSYEIFQQLETQLDPSDTVHLIIAIKGQANAQFRNGQVQQALANYERSLELAQTSSDILSQLHILNHLVNTYRQLGDYRKSGDFLDQGFEIIKSESVDSFSDEFNEIRAKLFVTRAVRNLFLSDTEQGAQDLADALSIYQYLNNFRGISLVLGLQGARDIDNEDYPSAQNKLEESLRIAKQIPENERIYYAKSKLGLLNHKLGNIDVSRTYYQEIIASADNLENPKILMENHYRLAEICFSVDKDVLEGLRHLNDAEDNAIKHQDKYWLIKILLKKVEIYLGNEDYYYAFARLEELLELYNQIINSLDEPLQRQEFLNNFESLPDLYDYATQCI